MQLLAAAGHEHVSSVGLGWIDGDVEVVRPAPAPDGRALKVPHMGWNQLRMQPAGAAHPVLTGIADGDHAYFVHTYAMTLHDPRQLPTPPAHGSAVPGGCGPHTPH